MSSNFPTVGLDDDVSLPPVNDNIVEIGSNAINAIRDAVFNIQNYLGLGGNGSTASISTRIGVSLLANGAIKPSAITGLGLVTLPITQDQIVAAAGIPESKLALDHATQDLFNNIIDVSSKAQEALGWISATGVKLDPHLLGLTYRHTFDQLDISNDQNNFFKNKFRVFRDNTNGYTLFNDVNNELLNHQFADGTPFGASPSITTNDGSVYPSIYGHTASGIFINTSRFIAIPQTTQDLQQLADFIDSSSLFLIGTRVQNLYSNGISKSSRSSTLLLDGYGQSIIPNTPAIAYLLHVGTSSAPFDDIDAGDDMVEFKPDASQITSNAFDEKFALVKIGDIIRINYGSIESQFVIKEKKYIQDSGNKKYLIRIAGKNLSYSPNAIARIDKPLFNINKSGVLALAAANNNFSEIPSLIVGSSRGAQALGSGFNPDAFDTSHYNLYLTIYPTGNPLDGYGNLTDGYATTLPAIDVTGDKGISAGKYTLDSIVEATNNAFRQPGFNYRFIAYSYQGQFGIMLADSYNNISFSIISATVSPSGFYDQASTEFRYPKNVVGIFPVGNAPDPLGLGPFTSNIASPPLLQSYGSAEAAQNPTKILVPLKKNTYYVNGTEREKLTLDIDQVLDVYGDGYWFGTINNVQVFPGTPGRVETTYRVFFNLSASQLKAGKTVVIQSLGQNEITDFGRFIIKSVTFVDCDPDIYTDITVYDSVHAFGTSPTTTLDLGAMVAIYFNSDSVSFNKENSNDFTSISPFKRHFEVYIDQNASTFTHERGRFVFNSTNFTVNGVVLHSTSNINKINLIKISSKLRGYQFSSVNKITLNITSLDNISGSFSGYLASYDGTIFTHLGPVTIGKIGTVTRFYDETNIDYIDFLFDLSDIPSSFTNFVLDVQLFPTLSLDDEIMLIGTCQLNDNNKTIKYLRDERQFGNVSERQLSTSAIDFITTGEKLLHTNGVIRGFDIISTAQNTIVLRGGTVLVNGKFINVNNQTIIIPAINELYLSTSYKINFALCINSIGELLTIPLTDFDTSISNPLAPDRIFTAINPVTLATYNLDSSIFTNLIENRKDLTILYIVANLNVIGVDGVSSIHPADARKFINDGDSISPITWTSDNAQGNFRSLTALNSWLKFNNSFNNKVILKGNFNIDNPSQVLTLDYTNLVEFIGDGAVFNISYKTGINIGSNVKLKNIRFNYSYDAAPDPSYSISNLVNSITGTGVIFILVTNNKNIFIEECEFNYSLINRFPIINILMNDNTNVLQNLSITKNRFNSLVTDAINLFSDFRAVISIRTSYTSSSLISAKLIDMVIEGNVCNQDQMIILSASNMVNPPSLINGSISKNICGSIGFTSTYEIPQNFVNTDTNFIRNKNVSLRIEKNTCKLIATLNFRGFTFQSVSGSPVPYTGGSGTVIIKNNTLSWLQPNNSSLIISRNTFIASDPAFLNTFVGSTGIAKNYAYYDLGFLASQGFQDELEISNNQFYDGSGLAEDGTTVTSYLYALHIKTGISARIMGNIFASIQTDTTNSYFILFNYGGSDFKNAIVMQNKFYKNGALINKYIGNIGNGDTCNFIVTNNFFDSTSANGVTNILASFGGFANFTYHTNINQIKKASISIFDGEHTIYAGQKTTGDGGLNSSKLYFERSVDSGGLNLTLNDADNIFAVQSAGGFGLANGAYAHFITNSTTTASRVYNNYTKTINLNAHLPQNVTILSAKYGAYSNTGSFTFTDTNQNFFKLEMMRLLPPDNLTDVRFQLITVSNRTGEDVGITNSVVNAFKYINSSGDQTALRNATQFVTIDTVNGNADIVGNPLGDISSIFRTGNDYTINLFMEINFKRDVTDTNTLNIFVSPVEITYKW